MWDTVAPHPQSSQLRRCVWLPGDYNSPCETAEEVRYLSWADDTGGQRIGTKGGYKYITLSTF